MIYMLYIYIYIYIYIYVYYSDILYYMLSVLHLNSTYNINLLCYNFIFDTFIPTSLELIISNLKKVY